MAVPTQAGAEAPARGWWTRARDSEVSYAVLAGLAGMVAAALAMRLWDADLDIPFWYRRDEPYFQAVIKDILESTWVWTNPQLGAPQGLELYDFPQVPLPTLLVPIKAIGLLTGGDAAVTINLYFLLTFGLSAAFAFLLFRWLGVSRLVAGACAVLFAIAPYHLLHNQSHLLASSYWLVPISVYLTLALTRGQTLFERREGRGLSRWLSRRTVATLLVCVLLGWVDLYYVFYTLVLVVTASIAAAVAYRDARRLVAGLVVAATITLAALLALSPVIVYRLEHGPNQEAFQREPKDTERLSLNITQLVMPIPDHRIGELDELGTRYRSESVAGVEWHPLGAAAAIGFVWLLVVALVAVVRPGRGPPADEGSLLDDARHRHLSLVAMVALAFGSTGGLSSIIAWTITADIRAWGRIMIFIAVLSLGALGLLLDRAGAAARRRWRVPAPAAVAVLALLLVLAFLDQTSRIMVPDYADHRTKWRAEESFVGEIERLLPADAAVFQLPYVPFPEGFANYWVPFAGYLHSEDLRWSYASMRGRDEDWQSSLAGRPPSEVVPAISAVGFQGLWLDRGAAGPEREAFEAGLRRTIGYAPAVERADGTFAFWDLRDYNRRLRTERSATELALLSAATLGEGSAKLRSGQGGEEIELGPGETFPVAPGAARGFVDEVSDTATGWAIDEESRDPAAFVVAFAGDRFLALGRPDMERPDLARLYGPDAVRSGFRLDLPDDVDEAEVRVFAVAGREASELSR